MGTSLTGLFLGAGASYEAGLPLVWEITRELKDWLTPDKLRSLNEGWRAQGSGHSDAVIEDASRTLANPDMHYESILGYLETQFRRQSTFQQEYHGLYSWLVEMVYHLLCIRHTKNVSYIERHLDYYKGITHLVAQNEPLWIFSLNHDVIIEALATYHNIPLNCGFTDNIFHLPRRDKKGVKTGELKAETISGELLEKGEMPFFQTGTNGINLLKIHGSLDIFTFRDGKDMLRLLPTENTVSGVIESLRLANEELVYIHPAAPRQPIKTTNEITYADDDGEMQFLRRTLLAGAYKFDSRMSQVLPPCLLDRFRTNINYLSSLICIGYGFGDMHINNVIREWLEFSADRKLEIVGPSTESIPSVFLHLAPQITLRKIHATEFFDRAAGIVRSKRETVEMQLSEYIRCNGQQAHNELREFIKLQMDLFVNKVIEKLKSLPIRDGEIDFQTLGMEPEELARTWMSEVSEGGDDIIEAFLRSKNDTAA
jgi:hypothetical protein